MLIKRIPILMYHSIEPRGSKRFDEGERFYNVTHELFMKEMEYLKCEGYKTITLREFLRAEDDGCLPEKPIVLTFDDGHISHYDTVLPILKEYGFSAVFFLVVNDIEKENRVNWDQARALRDAGMEIGSHGMNHIVLNKSSYLDLINEMKSSKIFLEDNLESEIFAFSVPRGFYSAKLSEVARGTGYKLMFTSFTGNSSLYSDFHRLRRTVMIAGYTMKDFVLIVRKDPIYIAKKRLEQLARNGLRQTIGSKGYDRVKRALFAKV